MAVLSRMRSLARRLKQLLLGLCVVIMLVSLGAWVLYPQMGAMPANPG